LNKEYCVSTGDLVIGERKTCYGAGFYQTYDTPPLASVSFTAAEKTYEWLDVDVTAEIRVWVGFETDLSHIWAGTNTGQCYRKRIDPPNVSPTADIRDVMDETRDWVDGIVEWLDDTVDDAPDSATTAGEILLSAILLIILLIWTGISGGANLS
jgi:hypothetical protein